MQGGIEGSRTLGYDGLGDVHSYNINGYVLTLDHDETAKPYHIDFNGSGQYSAFGYSGTGQRGLTRTRDGATHAYSFAGSEPGAAPLSDGRTVFTPGVGQRDTATGQSRFALTDALGGSRALLGPDRSILDDQRFDAWGGVIYHGGSSPGAVPLGWGAMDAYQSDDSGLVLMGHRYYDPAVGRFLSPDPAGDGDNWYAYCDNDPVDEADPTGLTPSGAPNGSSYGDPLGGQLFSIADYSSSIANGMGHWSHGAPTGYVKGQPTVAGGEINTNWVPSDNTVISLIGGTGLTFAAESYYLATYNLRHSPRQNITNGLLALNGSATLVLAARGTANIGAEKLAASKALSWWKLGAKGKLWIAGRATGLGAGVAERAGIVGLMFSAAQVGWGAGTWFNGTSVGSNLQNTDVEYYTQYMSGQDDWLHQHTGF